MSRQDQVMLRVQKGALVPADGYSQQRMRDKGYHVGDLLAAKLSKPRNPRFHRLMHAFGRLVSENVDSFEGMPAHAVLKRLQLESGIECDTMLINLDGTEVPYRVARSISYASMDQGDATEFYSALCAYFIRTYWPTVSEEEITHMIDLMPEVA